MVWDVPARGIHPPTTKNIGNMASAALYRAESIVFTGRALPRSGAVTFAFSRTPGNPALEWLHQVNRDDHLDDATVLSSLFPGGPSSSNVVNIMISDPEVEEMSDGIGDSDFDHIRRVKKDLGNRIASLRPTSSPSETVSNVGKIRQLIEGEKAHVHVGRPGGAPAAIFNLALAALQSRLENLRDVEVDFRDIANAADYLDRATKTYDDEAAREKAIQDCIDIAVGQRGEWNAKLEWADAIKPRCAWWHKLFLMIVLELKNIKGLSGNPSLQSLVDYGKIISHMKYQQYQQYTNFPVVLLGVAENQFDISIAVCIGEIHVSKLLSIDVTAGFLVSGNILRLAQAFKAISFYRVELQAYYEKVEKKAQASKPLSCLYPQPRPVEPTVTIPDLTYKRFMTRSGEPTSLLVSLGGEKFTAMYTAALGDIETDVIVKFTPRYSEKAHRLLADAGFAPKLHFCTRVVGGLFMSVMDRVEGKSIWQLIQEEEPIPAIVSRLMSFTEKILYSATCATRTFCAIRSATAHIWWTLTGLVCKKRTGTQQHLVWHMSGHRG
ncbi:hypothetical protein H0H81_002109 [Sphagnurus paluster]|uniref:Uncharacterized protein n=1 Tax=Sphagnurus paluster TaxID=117069 RepID=A0A9P7GMR4_9AGAR|nr:hypothetical protein H0H81_002109 [Sphagnurus paluster]